MRKLKPVAYAAIILISQICASKADASTVTILTNTTTTDVTTDPNASPAIIFQNNTVGTDSSPTITGNVVAAAGAGATNFDLNGTTTINGDVGQSSAYLDYVSTGLYVSTSRLADGNVYTFNGQVYANNFYINNGSAGLAYTSTVVLGGAVSAPNLFNWSSPNAGKISTLDLQGNSLTTGMARFNSNGGTFRLISTITASGGQATCTAGNNTAGCISATYNGGMPPLDSLPSSLQLQIRVANGVTLTAGTKYTIVDFSPSSGAAVPTLTSSITSLTSGFSFAQDTTNTQDLVITVTGAPIYVPLFQPNAGPVAGSAAGILDGLSATATDPGMIAAISALQGMNTATQAAALRRVAPETGYATDLAPTQVTDLALGSVESRLDGIRQNGFTLGMADELKEGKVIVASNGSLAGLLDGSPSHTHGVWAKLFGAHGDQTSQDNFAGFGVNTWGMTVGADSLLESKWVVGGALSYAKTDVGMRDFRTGDSTGIQTYQAMAYASRNFGAWYLDSMAAYAYQRYDSIRNTTVSGTASGSFGGDQIAARVLAGHPIPLTSKTTVTPLAGLEWQHLDQNGYTETGAGALSLSVQGRSAERLRSTLGAKLETAMELSDGTKLKPSVHAAWMYDFKNSGVDTTATFVGGGPAFVTPGQALARNSFNVGAALAIQRSRNFTLTLQVDGEKSTGFTSYAGQAVGQWRF